MLPQTTKFDNFFFRFFCGFGITSTCFSIETFRRLIDFNGMSIRLGYSRRSVEEITFIVCLYNYFV